MSDNYKYSPAQIRSESDVLLNASALIEDGIRKQFELQGHHLTGTWEESITSTMVAPNHIEGMALSYGSILNAGTPADRIPYGGESRGDGTGHSKYIEGLRRFWIARGKSEKEALSLAFATAKVQKREGMPTAGSYLYTSTGYRTNFIGLVQDIIESEVDEIVTNGMDQLINAQVNEQQLITY